MIYTDSWPGSARPDAVVFEAAGIFVGGAVGPGRAAGDCVSCCSLSCCWCRDAGWSPDDGCGATLLSCRSSTTLPAAITQLAFSGVVITSFILLVETDLIPVIHIHCLCGSHIIDIEPLSADHHVGIGSQGPSLDNHDLRTAAIIVASLGRGGTAKPGQQATLTLPSNDRNRQVCSSASCSLAGAFPCFNTPASPSSLQDR
jgi:hypothetical protein